MSNTPRTDKAVREVVIANGGSAVRDGIPQRLSVLVRESMLMEAQLSAALYALRDLYDEQNGPPLLTDEAAWRAAMERARQILQAHDA